ncbi:MAG: DUF4367 domain-containing protein [Solobacterium sp.]|nr:DUF4367 domain-containing protein [Solobacterium sp.]
MSEKKEKKSFISDNIFPILIAFAVVMGFMLISSRGGGFLGGNQMIPSFGQEPVSVWTELPNEKQAEIIAGFEIELPESVCETHPNVKYLALSKTELEIQYSNNEGQIGMAVRKAGLKTKGIDFDTSGSFQKIETIDIDGVSVLFKGNDGLVEDVYWSDAEYQYAFNCKNAPVTQEEAERLVKGIK